MVQSWVSLSFVLFDQQKWTDDHAELPKGYLVYPSSMVSAFRQNVLEECTTSNSTNSLGAVKSARKLCVT